MAAEQFRNALPLYTVLHDYCVEAVLGTGGFGITYRARDLQLQKAVAIKEYLPSTLAMRGPQTIVQALSTQAEADFRWGLERFVEEARTLARFSHSNIVRVLRFFEANGTAYMVMEHEEGESLESRLKNGPISEAELRSWLAPLLDGLAAVHGAGFLHRDIKPGNVVIRADGTPVLIDFGAARHALGGGTRTLTAVLTPGYAPLEQYSGDVSGKSVQGPWTDLYALGGVLFHAVSGQPPADAVARLRNDTVHSTLAALRGRYSDALLRAIEWALAPDEKDRPQSVRQWREAIFHTGSGEKTVVRPLEQPQKKPLPRLPIYAAAAVLAIAVTGAIVHRRSTPPAPESEPAAAASPLIAEKLQRVKHEVEAEFRAADANHDGFLSPDEVRGRFPALARNFAEVDADRDGRISPREFVQFRRLQFERRAARQANSN